MNKHHPESTHYLAPELEPILLDDLRHHRLPGAGHGDRQENRGLYLGGADNLRRAMGKKKMDVMQRTRAFYLRRYYDPRQCRDRRRRDGASTKWLPGRSTISWSTSRNTRSTRRTARRSLDATETAYSRDTIRRNRRGEPHLEVIGQSGQMALYMRECKKLALRFCRPMSM